MSAQVKLLALILAGGGSTACSVILDFEPENPPQCWCGERWQGQVSGALAFDGLGNSTPVVQTKTTYSRCVSQAEHVALNEGDPTLTSEFTAGAIVECEAAALAAVGGVLVSTTCAEQGASVSHVGACWEPDPDLQCPLLSECRAKYDCDPEPVWKGYDGETGGAVEPSECVQ